METKKIEQLKQDKLPAGPEEIEIECPEEIKEIEESKVLKLKTSDKLYFYWYETKVFFLFFVILEIAQIILSQFKATIFTAENILPGIILIFEIFVLVGLSARFAKYKDIKKSFLVPVFFAFIVGVVVALVRVVEYLEVWTFYNLILEPGIMIILAFLVSLIVNLIILITRKVKIIFYNSKKIKKDLSIN